jgi:cytochrome c peroxidase
MSQRIVLGFLGVMLCTAGIATAQTPDPTPPPPLETLPVPEPENLSEFVSNKDIAILLGKALFWDMQVGSDGIQACASCHFHAGIDSRAQNQLSPGLLNRALDGTPAPDHSFSFGPNFQLGAELFPLRKLLDPTNRASAAERDTNDVVSSQGVFNNEFIAVVPGHAEDLVDSAPDPAGFQVGGINVRRVEPRHTPTMINAVFNHRNFWDGRAQNEFNGVNIWGTRDPNARLYKATSLFGLQQVSVLLPNSSLASQAVGPPTNAFEMSADGRSFPDLARKLARMRPLGRQLVHRQDSVLGPLSRWPHKGIYASYDLLVALAFRPEWWLSTKIIRVNGDGSTTVISWPNRPLAQNEFTLLEYNFSLFFGLSVQLYESTLVSDDAPYDRFMKGTETLSPEALEGLGIFLRSSNDGTGRAIGRCIGCHGGSTFTDATVQAVATFGETRTRLTQDIDTGWVNIGARPTLEDLAVGGLDAFGNPLSVTRLRPKSTNFIGVDGAFKIPTLRNIELTAPYFHNGAHLTLESVVSFYSRGGDFFPLIAADGATELRGLGVVNMTASEQAALVAFLKTLTDERVRYRRAPFDHPQLFVPDGQEGDHLSVVEDPARPGQALDFMREIPAVGRFGANAPLPGFLED